MYRHDWWGVHTWQCFWWRPIAYQTPVTSSSFFFLFFASERTFSVNGITGNHIIMWMPLALLGMIIIHSLSLCRTAVHVSLFSLQCLGSAQIYVDVGTHLDAAAYCKPNFKQQSELSNVFILLRIANDEYCSSHEVGQMTWSNEKIVSLTSFSRAHFSPLNKVTNIMVQEWE